MRVASGSMLALMGKLIPFARLLALRFLRDTAGMSWESRMRILDVLQKAHQLRLARLEAAAVIERASQQAPYPLPAEQVNASLDPCDPWHTGPEESGYAIDRNANPLP
jgi:hypothetical protein